MGSSACFVVVLGMDKKNLDGSSKEERAYNISKLYRSISRGMLSVSIINEQLENGLLSFLSLLKSQEDEKGVVVDPSSSIADTPPSSTSSFWNAPPASNVFVQDRQEIGIGVANEIVSSKDSEKDPFHIICPPEENIYMGKTNVFTVTSDVKPPMVTRSIRVPVFVPYALSGIMSLGKEHPDTADT